MDRARRGAFWERNASRPGEVRREVALEGFSGAGGIDGWMVRGFESCSI